MTDAVLELVLAGPLQSWGWRSDFNRRDTGREPTKSGVLGLLAAAQGRRREDPIDDLRDLRMAVRIDQPGTVLRDYHTVSDLRGRPLLSATVRRGGRQAPTSPPKYTHVTQRFYLQDAVFVVLLQGHRDLVDDLARALRAPRFPLALGRRSCPPGRPVLLGVHPAHDLDTRLAAIPWQASHAEHRRHIRRYGPAAVRLPVVIDDPHGRYQRVDVPLSFDLRNRRHIARTVRHDLIQLPVPADAGDQPDPDIGPDVDGHDPMAILTEPLQ